MITDWDKRMSLYNYSTTQRSFVKRSEDKQKEYFTFKNHPEWKSLISDPKNDIEIFSRSSTRGLTCLKAVGHLDFTPKQVWLTLCGGSQYRL